jgi:O-antigen/teichoic acid export membrane protein
MKINPLPSLIISSFLRSKLIKDISWDTAAVLITKLKGFILILVISHYVGVHWYGAWSLIYSLSSYAILIATLMLPNAIVRYFPEEKEINHIFVFLFSMVFFISLLISFIIAFFADQIVLFFLKNKSYVGLVFYGAFSINLNAMNLMLQNYFRARDDLKMFSLIQIAFSMMEVLIITTVLIFSRDLVLAMKIFLIISFCFECIILLRILRCVDFKKVYTDLNLKKLKEYLKYSLPLVPSGFLNLVSNNGDRFLIGYFLDSKAVGLYSVAYSLASIVMLFNPPITDSLFPKVSKWYSDQNFLLIRKRVKDGIIIFSTIGISFLLIVLLFGNYILGLLTRNETFMEEYDLIFVTSTVTIALIMYGVSRIHSLYLFVQKRTQVIFLIYLTSATVNIGLNLVLIKLFALSGAAVSTLLSYFLILVGVFYTSRVYSN